jgi:ABC-type transporter Mla subunit MlaD
MSATSTHVRLGLLAIAGMIAATAAIFALGLHGSRAATVIYHTYFDESVQGLDIGAPVKYRGVRIGNIAAIEIAPDRKRVDVSLELIESDVQRLGFASATPDLRTELSSQGITGVKFIEIDFVDPAASPPPVLPFPPAGNYLAARASMLKGLQDNLEAVGQKLPQLVDRAIATLDKLEVVLDDFSGQHVTRQVADVVAGIGRATADVRSLVQHVDRAQLGDRAAGALGKLDGTVAKLDRVLDRLDGDAGLVASARRAAESIGDVGIGATGSALELERTLHDIGDAAQALRALVEAIDRDPDMLVKGRARSSRP